MDRQQNTKVEAIRQQRRAASAMRQGNYRCANKAARRASRFAGTR